MTIEFDPSANRTGFGDNLTPYEQSNRDQAEELFASRRAARAKLITTAVELTESHPFGTDVFALPQMGPLHKAVADSEEAISAYHKTN